jgi:hypothetical protein
MNAIRALVPAILLTASLSAQMEKRDAFLYDREAFLAAEPRVGTRAPELLLTGLDGKPMALSSCRGRIVVLIKAGFT